MKAKRWIKYLTVLLLCIAMVWTCKPNRTEASDKDEKTYVKGQVIVMFSSGAVKDSETSLKSAQKLENVDADFGDVMDATGEASEAARDAKSEVSIVGDSLGDDFTILDSIAFDDDLTVALVSSDAYDTDTMIKKLSANKNVVSAEPNYIRTPQSTDYTYSLNDAMNAYNYQANNPLAHNDKGLGTSMRGSNVEVPLSTNSGSIRLTEEEKKKEMVVGIVDSGILIDHEDLKNMLWENPGDIGLEGEHGYNFYNNNTDIKPTYYHGTHCSGILAAQANNGVGIAGTATAAGANVKIMMLSTDSAGEDYEKYNSYKEMGALHYILKAKQRGVNIVATSNSWTNPGNISTIFDEIVNRLGEEGILTFVAAGNYWKNLDRDSAEVPASGDSPYLVVVGAAGVSGRPAPFTNFGKNKVDVFAPGVNILSTVSYSCYFPNIYSRQRRIDTTEYYGLFDGDMEFSRDGDGNPCVTASKGDTDDTVKAFGPSVFHAQPSSYGGDDDEEGSQETGAETTYELTKSTDRLFTDSENPASLKLTIHHPKPYVNYYFYFPYEKNPATTGIENTKFSIYVMNSLEEGDKGYTLLGGEVQVDENGDCSLTGYGNGPKDAINDKGCDDDAHICENYTGLTNNLIIGADELEESGKSVGIGICLSTVDTVGKGDIHVYLDSVAVSRPDTEIPQESAIIPETSYDISSGTSMAAPACAGAYIAYAASHPIKDGQSPSEYALENRAGFLSCVTRTPELKDKCATGGFIDLTHMGEINPVITDAVCNIEKETLTLYGRNLNDGYSLRYKKLEDKNGNEIKLPSDGMELHFKEDGTEIEISNAKSLFGRYVEFLLYDKDNPRASNTFFLVKGQKLLKEVCREEYKIRLGEEVADIKDRKLFTDTKGQTLYGFEPETGILYRYNGSQFSKFQDTDLRQAALTFITKEKDIDNYDRVNNLNIKLERITDPLCMGNRLYHIVHISRNQGSETLEGGQEQYHYLATADYTSQHPKWTFSAIDDSYGVFTSMDGESKCAAMSGKIYLIREDYDNNDPKSMVYSYDIDSGKWSREADMPAKLEKQIVTVKDQKMYVMLGGGYTDDSGKDMLSRKVYCFDGSSWTTGKDIPYTGKYLSEDSEIGANAEAVCAPVKNGFVFMNCTADGYGNTFLYDPDSGECQPLYYTINDFKADLLDKTSAVETKEGIYYIYEYFDGADTGYVMCLLPRDSGTYQPSYPESLPSNKARLNKTSVSLKAGKTFRLKVSNGKVVNWTSSNGKVAKIKNGKIIALKKGKTTIYANLKDGTYLKCNVKVKTSPRLSVKSLKVKKGKTKTIKIKGKAPGVNNVYTKTKYARILSKKNAVKIKVKGLKKGKTILKIKVNGVVLKLKVIVK